MLDRKSGNMQAHQLLTYKEASSQSEMFSTTCSQTGARTSNESARKHHLKEALIEAVAGVQLIVQYRRKGTCSIPTTALAHM